MFTMIEKMLTVGTLSGFLLRLTTFLGIYILKHSFEMSLFSYFILTLFTVYIAYYLGRDAGKYYYVNRHKQN